MANYTSGNVIFVDTDNFEWTGPIHICGIKYVGASTSSVSILGNVSSSGPVLWTDTGTTTKFEEVEIKDNRGIHVDVAGTATVYIYLKVSC